MISKKVLSILLYVLILLLIFVFEPAMIFDENGFIRCFDYDTENPNASLLAFTIIMPFLAILCYFVIIVIEVVFA